MLEENQKAFNPNEHLMQLKSKEGEKDYLPVQWRLVWFRNLCPNGVITTEMVHLDLTQAVTKEVSVWNADKRRSDKVLKELPGIAIFKATVEDGKGGVATGYGSESALDFGDFIEKAECVPLHSEILTRSGFRTHDQLTIGEEVLAYDVKQDICVWTPLRLVTVHPSLPMAKLAGQRFDVLCTPNHSWATSYTSRFETAQGKQISIHRDLIEAQNLKKHHNLVLAAPAPSGDSPLTPRDAAILGWAVTDGTIQKRGNYMRIGICQSKQENIPIIQQLVGAHVKEIISKPITRTFPMTGRTYETLPQSWFYLSAEETRRILTTAGFTSRRDLPRIVCSLSHEAREAMLMAMMMAEADSKGNFAQNDNPVREAFQLLATLEGFALGMPYKASIGDVIIQRLKKRRHLCASELQLELLEDAPAWCPTTDYGTWVMRQDGKVMITGNTKAIGRALAALGYGTQFAPELEEGARIVDAPVDRSRQDGQPTPQAQQQPPRPVPTRANTPTPQAANKNTSQADDNQRPCTPEQMAGLRQLYKKLGRTVPEDISQKSFLAVKRLMEQAVGEYRDLRNKKNSHAAPTSTENAPSPADLRKRATSLQVNYDALVAKILKENKPDDNQTPEDCGKLKRALDIIEERKKGTAEMKEAS